MPYLFAFVFLIFSCDSVDPIQKPEFYDHMVLKVNEIRENGCKCGNKTLSPVQKISWNEKLSKSAQSHADEMRTYDFFSHLSRKGENAGERILKFGYRWAVVGENIAEGQTDFDEALRDWLKSPSHCKMIMHPDVKEMGVARSGNYWVQHFGKRKTGN